MQIEPLALTAELVDSSGATVTQGLLSLSPTPGELELKGSELPRYAVGTTVGLIVHTLNGVLTSLVGSVSFYGRGILGICDAEEEGIEKLRYLLLQNIAVKTYATQSVGVFKRGDDYDISITRLNKMECCFTSIEKIEVGTVLNISIKSPLILKKLEVKVEEFHRLRNMVTIYIAKPIKISKQNLSQIEYFLG